MNTYIITQGMLIKRFADDVSESYKAHHKKSPCLFGTKLTQWILLARWALDRISWCGKSFMVIPKETLKCIAYRKSYGSQFRAYMAGSTEWVSSQTSPSFFCVNWFHLPLRASMSAHMIVVCVLLLATSHASLITSFKPPLHFATGTALLDLTNLYFTRYLIAELG